MEKNKLTGIERELVLNYLMDGNVPVTITPIKNTDPAKVQPLDAAVFPVAVKGEKLRVENNGKIFLDNPPQAVLNFAKKFVKVEFYFNRVGLYFTSVVEEFENGLVLFVPDSINKIEDGEDQSKYDFTARLYFECRTKSDLNINCVPWSGIKLFARPVWKDIPLENQQKAKSYLEIFVEQAKIEKNIGSGIQLIPICNYLTFEDNKMESVQNRQKPVSILYVDHERIILGNESHGFNLIPGAEYALKMSFTLDTGPVNSRDIFVTCRINKIFNDAASEKFCADCVYTSLQEEDLRFLYEKTTSKLFC